MSFTRKNPRDVLGVAVMAASLSLLLTACPGGYYEPPPAPDIKGRWSGTVNDSISGEGTLVITILIQDERYYGGTLSGSWQGALAGQNSGIVRGQMSYGEGVSLSLISATTEGCSYNVQASHEHEEGRLAGTYLSEGCDPYTTGTLELRKE